MLSEEGDGSRFSLDGDFEFGYTILRNLRRVGCSQVSCEACSDVEVPISKC